MNYFLTMNGMTHTNMNAKQLFHTMYEDVSEFPLFSNISDWQLMHSLIEHANIILKHPHLLDAEVDCFSHDKYRKFEYTIDEILNISTTAAKSGFTVVICNIAFPKGKWVVGAKHILLSEFKKLERHLYIDEVLETL